VFRVKSYFLIKEQSYRRLIDDLGYFKDLILELEYKDNLVNKAFNAPLLTNCGFKGYFKDRNGVITL
jgi:hypothetical protein